MRSFAFIVEKTRMYVITSRLYEHSNVVRFEKRTAKTLQHEHKYGNIFMLYDMIKLVNDFPALIGTNYVPVTHY